MDFALSSTAQELQHTLIDFMDRSVYPAEPVYQRQIDESGDPHSHPPIMEDLKAEARSLGLWNLFLPHKTEWTDGLSNTDYAPLAEIMGRCPSRVGGVQLLGSRHREHGDPHHVRHARAAGAVAAPAPGRRDPLCVRHDRARRRQLGCDQHRVSHRARR